MSRLAWTPPLRLARLAWLASLVACSSGVAPWAPGLRRDLTGHDYAAYSAWLFAQHPRPGMVLVDGRTTSTSYLGLSVFFPQGPVVVVGPGQIAPPTGVVPPQPVVFPSLVAAFGSQAISAGSGSPAQDEAAQDQRVQQELSLPLEPKLTGAAYRLVDDPVPADLLGQAGLIVAFSRVGFDRHQRVATFQVLLAPVAGGVVSSAGAYRVWLERPGLRWKLAGAESVETTVVVWTTTTPVPVGTPPTMICDSTHTTNCFWPPGPAPMPLPLPRPR
jgi:hypothetical protein